MGTTYYVSNSGSDTTGTGTSGSPYATPGKVGSVMTGTGNTINVQTGTYTFTSSANNVAGGLLVMPVGASGAPNIIQGYHVTPGDLDDVNDFSNFPVLLGSASGSAYCLNFTNSYCHVRNLILDGGNQASRGLGVTASFCAAANVKATRASSYGFFVDGAGFKGSRLWASVCGYGIYCDSYGCSFDVCVATANTTAGVRTDGYPVFLRRVLSYANTGSTVDGMIHTSSYGSVYDGCVAWGNGRDGIRFNDAGSADVATVRNCILGSNGGYNLRSATTTWGSGTTGLRFGYNFLFTSTSGNYSGLPAGAHDVTLTGDPFNGSSSGDFSLNATAGAGAAARGVGFPGVFPGGLTTGYLDGGAAQSQSTGGGTSGPTYFAF